MRHYLPCVIFIFLTSNVLSYKPVILLHGILTGADSMIIIEEEIKMVRIMKMGLKFIKLTIFLPFSCTQGQRYIQRTDSLGGLVLKTLGIRCNSSETTWWRFVNNIQMVFILSVTPKEVYWVGLLWKRTQNTAWTILYHSVRHKLVNTEVWRVLLSSHNLNIYIVSFLWFQSRLSAFNFPQLGIQNRLWTVLLTRGPAHVRG